jgi:hypothetical protein
MEFYRLVTDTTPPTVVFTDPDPGYIPYASRPTLRWVGDDGVDGSGIAQYILQRAVGEQPLSEIALNPADRTDLDLILDTPCRTLIFRITAIDGAGNRSEDPDTLELIVGLQGDVNNDGVIDISDLRAIEMALGLVAGQPGYSYALDINGDDRIDATDRCPVPSVVP